MNAKSTSRPPVTRYIHSRRDRESSGVRISVIIPNRNGGETLRRCLQAVMASTYRNFECIVVDDGSTDHSLEVIRSFPVRWIRIKDAPRGPAYARNRGAQVATGHVLFFLDADVEIRPDTLEKVARHFQDHPDTVAVFGSYDDAPAATDFISQYRNLLHHFVHQTARESAQTFWSGCGAIRRDVFLQCGGFRADRFPYPSIEDIELGYRLHAAGYRIRLDRSLWVKHLKRWSLRDMIWTDVFRRAVPWTLLILQAKYAPNDLNLHISQRISALLAYVMLLYLGLIGFFHNVLLLPVLIGLFIIVMGYWDAVGNAWVLHRMGRRAGIWKWGLMALAGGIAVYTAQYRILWPLGIMGTSLVTGRWLYRWPVAWQRVLFAGFIGGFVWGIAVLGIQFSFRLTVPLLFLLLIIIIFNYKLYRFFLRQRGWMFAVAVIPFHMLYYLYSLFGFALGVVIYYTRRSPDIST